MGKIIHSCSTHIEELLEIFLDEIEEMPVMDNIENAEMICSECEQRAKYRLSGSEVKAKWE